MQIVFIGPPGAGKGTQSVRLAQALGVPHLSTGDMLRDACERQTSVGLQANQSMQLGQLVPDELVQNIVFDRLLESDCINGSILDGFPRTVPQAEAFDQWLAQHHRPLSAVLEIRVTDEVLLKRLAGRGRDDDNRGVVSQRLAQYNELTHPLLEYYRQRDILQVIDGLGTAEEVGARIQRVVDEIDAKKT